MFKKILANKKYIRVIIIILVLIALGFAVLKYFNKPAKVTPTATETENRVSIGDIKIDFSGDGSAETSTINLDFDVSGKLEALYVKDGERIKKGQILAKIDDTQYQNNLKTAQVNYNKAVTSLNQTTKDTKLNLLSEKQKVDNLKISMQQAQEDYAYMLDVQDSYSKQELASKKNAYDNAKSAYDAQVQRYNLLVNSNQDIAVQRANVESAKLSLELARENLADTVLKAPKDAKILQITYSVGETVSTVKESGSTTADTTHFMVVADSDEVKVVIPVSEIDISKVKLGMKVDSQFDAAEGKTFSGKVVAIDALATIDSNGIVNYDVTVLLDGTPEQIKSGMTCSSNFILRESKNVLIIPNKAVSMTDGKQVVKVKGNNGKIETRVIKTGLTDGKNVEVTKGLNAGEIVIQENTANQVT